jgi:NAD(P)H dehydrogenase (quinone)
MKRAALLLWAAAMLPAQPARVLIAYHSETGYTQKLAQAIEQGAAPVNGVASVARKMADVRDEEILSADGIIVGTPVHWANVSAETKRFLDRAGAVLWKAKRNGDGRTAGAFCTGGGVAMGKDQARLSILAAFLTMRFTIVGGVDAEGFGTLGPEATTGPADKGLREAELAEARAFGERFARQTAQMRSGARK